MPEMEFPLKPYIRALSFFLARSSRLAKAPLLLAWKSSNSKRMAACLIAWTLPFSACQAEEAGEPHRKPLALFAEEEEKEGVPEASEGIYSKGYQKPPTASEESWNAVQPYLLPCDHPAKKALDQIFSGPRPLLSSKNMKKAGFFRYHPSDKSIIVSGHHRLRGYIVKAYLDTCPLPEWKLWIQRIVGADQVRQSIKSLGYGSIMKAPLKWIYPLPASSTPPSGDGFYAKHYILIAQDMGIVSELSSQENWKRHITASLLDAFYTLVVTNGLIDAYFIDNSPFCFDRKIAFLDTEHFNVGLSNFPQRQNVLFQFLSAPMRTYWEQLLMNGGPSGH